jgi:dihydrolipoamide dehydrogenase
MKVTLVDADPSPGGVCTFRGCIPSKALLHAARVLDEAKHATAFGMSFGTLSIDIAKLRGRKAAVVKKQTGGLGLLAKSRKVAFIHSRASIEEAGALAAYRAGPIGLVGLYDPSCLVMRSSNLQRRTIVASARKAGGNSI